MGVSGCKTSLGFPRCGLWSPFILTDKVKMEEAQ